MSSWNLPRTLAARALLEDECGRFGLFVLMVAGILHSYVRINNFFKDKYEEIPVWD
jgi:hypothetical protein